MKKALYPQLAWDGIRKNRRLYVPYLLTCVCVVMTEYILQFLSRSPLLEGMRGASSLAIILGMGAIVILVFSVIFLFYTNSFLIRRRRREFGLYNVLGMSRSNLCRIVTWEALLSGAISLTAGLALGVLLSKLSELCLIKMLGGTNNLRFTVDSVSLGSTAGYYCIIFALIWLVSLVRVRRSSAVALMKSSAVGEKPLRANWLVALLGTLLLGAAYYLAVSIESPVEAILAFFIAVLLVIVATYMLMVSGSTALCRLLQKNKRYYYHPRHFVSVSSMAYRMKRNGAGLASICILATMVLVMISSSSCLYFGGEDSVRNRYPREINMDMRLDTVRQMQDDNLDIFRESVWRAVQQSGCSLTNLRDLRYGLATGLLKGDTVTLDYEDGSAADLGALRQFFLMSAADYAKTTGQHITLAPGQAALFTYRCSYTADTLTITDIQTYQVVSVAQDTLRLGASDMDLTGAITLVVNDLDEALTPWAGLKNDVGDDMLSLRWEYGFDVGLDGDAQRTVAVAVEDELAGRTAYDREAGQGYRFFTLYNRADGADDFFGSYSGLFFIGILLSAVFIAAAVLILYYKQVSEGYEDRARFDIMKKVGMTGREIRRSINSHLVVVFFLPLAFAVLHLCFAFPLIRKLLMLFALNNVGLFAATTAISVGVFAVLYFAVYRVTSRVYYRIVSSAE